MERIGVRELRQSASVVLRRVSAGTSYEVTDRGRLVALLVPPPVREGLHGLYEAGLAAPPTAELSALGAPLPRPPGRSAPSAALAELREHER